MKQLLMPICLTFVGMILGFSLSAQTAKKNYATIGFEVDALPFVTGGYYGSIWVGSNHFRYRAIVTQLYTPKFYLTDGFTNNKIQAYTLIADYFFQPNFEKWWVGTGIEYWDATIQADSKIATASYNNTIFTVGGGYVWKFYHNFYLNPWVGIHLRVAGDKDVPVDAKVYKTSLLSPEASIKLGWHF
jgi:hypothetical protein